ncbi:tetratricopeptide repeat protein [uncultured Piscinibacter sp.]|uniref:tetratricopeptide repeat protein n=1 Tax=uncultured Piscinibacter sp. TaxID=1131835 RepID=UPI002607278D|nr:tetratricopeptide repeat protein [uncultured Piscinibacter sp.]
MHRSSEFVLRPLVVLMLVGLAGCAGQKKALPGDDQPTLASLAGRTVEVSKDKRVDSNETQTIAAYRKFLEVAPKAPQRAEAMRRLGDLEMDLADARSAAGSGAATGPDYGAAVKRYQDFLKDYPDDRGNDRVLYQLARAQEQAGDLETALKTLDRLVASYPNTLYRDEANFRRGELLFTTQDYARAEKAYATVLASSPRTQFHERSLYMQGWSRFKQGKLDDGLQSFFGVLDLKVAGSDGDGGLDTIVGLSRADRELVEDTFRVSSISLANLQGAESIPAYITDAKRRSYEYRVYEQLGELYLKQERVKDAADAFGAFARRDPLHAQAPQLQARVVEIYQSNGFPALALDAKKDYVSRYGVGSEFRRANPQGWEKAQPLVKTHLTELARHYHASAQKSKASADYQEAVKWYRAYIASYPNDPQTAQNNFLLAELLYEDGRFAEAAVEYEKVAYQYPNHARAADAGYAALLSYGGQEKRVQGAEAAALQRAGVESALRFAKAFPKDGRTGTVLTNASEKLFALRDGERAAEVAQQVLRLDPPAAAAQRRVAWTVIAHDAFERNRFDQSEKAYGEVLALTPEKDAARGDLVERLAASVYKQGELARAAGDSKAAVGHFNRVAAVAPASAVRATAQYDAAAAMLAMKDWDGASRALEDFRRRYPDHPLQADVGSKLALAYLEKQQWSQAAGEFERVAATQKDPQLAREALWQAAELHEKAADAKSGPRAAAAKTYERYLKQYPLPLERGLEARHRIARIARAEGDVKREAALMKEIYQGDQAGGSARTDRTRYLGATAALVMAEPAVAEYRKVRLVEPLARNLKLKKAKMESALKAYAVAANYGVADVTTAATFHIASLYQDFGQSMLKSERPKRLSKLEREQYDVLLEEQAFPFEEKAIELHEANAKRASEGIYDKWVKDSFEALARLRPVRYGKAERAEGVIDAIR